MRHPHVIAISSRKHYHNHNSQFNFRYADVISVGDEVLVRENNDMVPDKVTDVSTAILSGKNLSFDPKKE